MQVLAILGGLAFLALGVMAIFLAFSIRDVPDAHIAVVMFGSRRLNQVKGEGFRLFPFYPWLFRGKLIGLTRRMLDVVLTDIQTRDLARLTINIALEWSPDPRRAIAFLDAGEDQGVRSLLERRAANFVGQWARSSEWEMAKLVAVNTHSHLVSGIAGLIADDPATVAKLQTGDASHDVHDLGIVLHKVNITSIDPRGPLVQALEREAAEDQTRSAERRETGLDITAAALLSSEVHRQFGLVVSTESILQYHQVQSGKVDKAIRDIHLGIPAEVAAFLNRAFASREKTS